MVVAKGIHITYKPGNVDDGDDADVVLLASLVPNHRESLVWLAAMHKVSILLKNYA